MHTLETLPPISELVEEQAWDALTIQLDHLHVQDIADRLQELLPEQRLEVFLRLPLERRTPVFSHLERATQIELLDALGYYEARHLLSNLLPDDRTALLEGLPKEAVERFLKLLNPGEVRQALKLLGYPEQSVGRLMTTRYISVRPYWSILRAMAHIRVESRSQKGDTANVIFVTDDAGRLLGNIRLKQFLLGEPDETVESIMPDYFVKANADDDREEAVHLIQHYDLDALPVIDRDGALLGMVTVDDVMDVVEEETTEDFHKMGSVGALNLSLRDARPSLLYRKRVGWLLVLVFMNLFGGAAIAYFEHAIEALVVLVFFLPLIIDSGGNAGAQASTLMVRALATGDVQIKDWFRLWGKELGVAAALGLTMGAAVSLIGAWRGGFDVALVVAIAMTLVVIVGSLIGMALPFILVRLRLDPATASAPLITSVADISGIMIYFTVAVALLDLPTG